LNNSEDVFRRWSSAPTWLRNRCPRTP